MPTKWGLGGSVEVTSWGLSNTSSEINQRIPWYQEERVKGLMRLGKPWEWS